MTSFYVKVETDCDKFGIDNSGTFPVVRLVSRAEQGRANTELVERLSDILGVNVGIMSGHTSRRKKLVADIEKDEIESILRDYNE